MAQQNKKKYKFRFSVVIPVYKVEKYLAETLDSVIKQTIGFKEHIQIILVNDGSPDNSKDICLKYQKQYPDNIVYVEQENGGVSSARNTGIKYIEGKYVNFLDSDDCWQEDAFEEVYKFFEASRNRTDVVGARKQFFDAKVGFHFLDYKFKRTRIVNLYNEYECIQMDVTSAFIKADAIGDVRFSTDLKYGEDAQFINTILMNKCTLGVVREAVHLYRKRKDETSALQNELQSPSYYFDSPKYFHQYLFELSQKKFGRIIEFIQFAVMYDIHWRIEKPVYKMLDEADTKKYFDIMVSEIKQVNDRIILKQRMSPYMKIYALNLKYGRDIRSEIEYDHARLMFQNSSIINLLDFKSIATLHFVDIIDNKLYLEGCDTCMLPDEDYTIHVEVKRSDDRKSLRKYILKRYDLPKFDVYGMDGKLIFKGKGFKIAPEGSDNGTPIKQDKEIFVPLEKGVEYTISLIFTYKGIYSKKVYVNAGKFAHLPTAARNEAYYIKDDYIVRFSNKVLKVIPFKKRRHLKYELAYCSRLRKLGKGYLVKWRLMHYLLHPFFGDKVWLISDRVNKANDNGEHLFKYACSVKNKKVKPYYVINKSSEDYEKMKKIGKVIPFGSWKYRLYFLLSNKIASSSGNEYVINAFENDRIYMNDLYKFDYIFLQHGVTKDDLSDWVNKYNKDIKVLVTAGRTEQKSFADGEYYYPPEIPVLSGFPRHDNLMRMQKASSQSPEKRILLIPTWRKTIKGSYNPKTGESVYFDGFKDTEYFSFYNSLIKDERLLDCMRKHGYTGLFCMHPSHTKQSVDFEQNDVFRINEGYVDYQKQFAECSLLITDYSSVFFDFAYLKKPIVYSQFDKETFFEGEHAYKKGYFSYEDNGFGPVCYDLESTVNSIIAEIENDCRNSEKYIRRIEEFYPYFDENSCKRVYEAIENIPH